MSNSKKMFLALAVVTAGTVFSASAQIYVRVRPVLPVVVRTEAPSPRHVWVNEEWRERDGRYEYNGGHWVAPPQEGYRYRPGHWDNSKRGQRWHEGTWNRNDGRGRGRREEGRRDRDRH